MTFSDDVQLQFNMNQYTRRDDASAAVRLIPYRLGGTNTADAIRYARDNMFNPGQSLEFNCRNQISMMFSSLLYTFLYTCL